MMNITKFVSTLLEVGEKICNLICGDLEKYLVCKKSGQNDMRPNNEQEI